MDPLALLNRLFDTILVCDAGGNVTQSFGRPILATNVCTDPVYKAIWPLIQDVLKGHPFEASIDWEVGERATVRGVPTYDGAGGFVLAIGHPNSPSMRVRKDRLETPEYEFIIQNMRQGLWRVSANEVILTANEYLATWLETTVDDLVGSPIWRFLISREGDSTTRYEAEFETTSGIRRRAIVVSCEMVTPRGRPLGSIDIITDITAEHALRTKLVEEVQRQSRLARTDPLTGIANRIEFEEMLKGLQGSGDPFALVLADLDAFKDINDTKGHAVGDLALVEFARRLRSAVRDTDLVARIGGDEFAVLVAGASPDTAAEVVDRLEDRLSFSVAAGEAPIEVRFSVGWAHSDDHPETIMTAADREMYRQKRRRKKT